MLAFAVRPYLLIAAYILHLPADCWRRIHSLSLTYRHSCNGCDQWFLEHFNPLFIKGLDN